MAHVRGYLNPAHAHVTRFQPDYGGTTGLFSPICSRLLGSRYYSTFLALVDRDVRFKPQPLILAWLRVLNIYLLA